MNIILNTGGTAFQGAVIKGGRKFTDEYPQEAAYCDINLEDFEELGKPWFVKVTNEYGDSVILRAKRPTDSKEGRSSSPAVRGRTLSSPQKLNQQEAPHTKT